MTQLANGSRFKHYGDTITLVLDTNPTRPALPPLSLVVPSPLFRLAL